MCDGKDNDCDGVVPSDEADTDGDNILDCIDNCPNTYNPGQEDADGDGIGDVCESGDVSIFTEQDFIDRGENSVSREDTISYTITATNFFEDAVTMMISDAIGTLVDYVGSLTIYEAEKDVTPEDDQSLWNAGGLLKYESGILDYDESLIISFEVEVKDIAEFGAMIENVAWVTAYFVGSSEPVIINKPSNVTEIQVKETIPEPATIFLIGTGLIALLVYGRKKL